MENEINDSEFDYLMSLANEELKIPIPNFANLKVDSDDTQLNGEPVKVSSIVGPGFAVHVASWSCGVP